MIWFKYEIIQKQKNTFTFGLNAENTHYLQKKLQIKVVWHRISDQKSVRAYVFPLPPVELGSSKDDTVEILNCTETENEKKFPNNFYLKVSLE